MNDKWNTYDQSLYDCVKVALTGLKRSEKISRMTYEEILDKLQKDIDEHIT